MRLPRFFFEFLSVKAALLAVLAFAFLPAPVSAGEGSIVAAGEERRYILDVPADGPRPLILALHGGGGSADRFRRRSGLKEAALEAGFAIVFPDSDSGNWNDGRRKPNGELVVTQDDAAFLLALVKKLVETGVADPKRVYMVGHSNGGMMSFAMGCRHPKVFRAIAPVSANVPLPTGCAKGGGIAALNIVGLRDSVVPFEGGGIFGRARRGKLMSVDETWNTLLAKNGCASDVTGDRDAALLLKGKGCSQETFQLRLKKQGHSWPEGEVSTIVNFFARTK
jgi:polyhydroxybutyrate depolymerase